jgi:plastocyanin/mono/diheme cytochrome c family protein
MNTSKQINAMIVLLLLLLVGIGAYTIWDPFRAEAEADRIQVDMAERAASTFAKQCRNCHGDSGEGRVGPALNPEFRDRNENLIKFDDPLKRAENHNLVTNTLNCGRIGTVMPAWSQAQGGALTDEQIRRLVILITEPPPGAWDKVTELSHEQEAEGIALPPVDQVLASSAVTGSGTTYICGQKPVATPTPDTGPIEVKADWTVVATDNKFDVRSIGVPANQPVSVTFQNKGGAAHNWTVQGVQATDGKPIGTAQVVAGGQSETVRFTAATPGTYKFLCTLHPAEMTGTFKVE